MPERLVATLQEKRRLLRFGRDLGLQLKELISIVSYQLFWRWVRGAEETIEVWTKSRLMTFYLLFVIELKTQRVHFAGCTSNPNEAWMKRIARNLTDAEEGFLRAVRQDIWDFSAWELATVFRILPLPDLR